MRAALTRQQVQAVIDQCADMAKDLRDASPLTWLSLTASSACGSPTAREEPRASDSKPKAREYRQMAGVRGGS
jgi:hypothetical protein